MGSWPRATDPTGHIDTIWGASAVPVSSTSDKRWSTSQLRCRSGSAGAQAGVHPRATIVRLQPLGMACRAQHSDRKTGGACGTLSRIEYAFRSARTIDLKGPPDSAMLVSGLGSTEMVTRVIAAVRGPCGVRPRGAIWS